jgi:hypothetical protein
MKFLFVYDAWDFFLYPESKATYFGIIMIIVRGVDNHHTKPHNT